mgnify:CR=1 FL=1
MTEMISTKQKKERPIRFQDCPWYIRAWRYRWYLLIPWWTVRGWLTPWLEMDGSLSKEEPWNTWAISYSIAVGTAQGKMEWYYTWEEVKASLNKTLKRVREDKKKRKKKKGSPV